MTTFSGLFSSSGGSGVFSTPHRGYKSGKYYLVNSAIDATTDTSANFVVGTVYYMPFYVHSDVAISALTFSNTSAAEAGHNIRAGIYANDGGEPSSLVVAAAVVTLTAAIAQREVAVSANLSKGWYWFALHGDSASTIRALSANVPNNYGWSFNGTASGVVTINSTAARSAASAAYGALASTAAPPTAVGIQFTVGIKVA